MRTGNTVSLALALLVLGANIALAAPIGLVQSASGEVWKYSRSERAKPVKSGTAFESGVSIATGAGSTVILRFQDGQLVALGSNTTFRIKAFTFDPADPAGGHILFELVRGSLRAVTGTIGKSHPGAWQLITPDALVNISGTDFLAVMEHGLYAHVNAGAITLTNGAGTTTLAAGQSAFVASEFVAPAAASAVPEGIFNELQVIALNVSSGAAPSPGAASQGAGAAAAAPVISKTAVFIAIGAAAIAAGAGGGSSTTTHH